MTITVAPARNEYTANAGQTIFNYTFKIFDNTDLNVYITPAGQDANDSTDLTTAYTVSGVGIAAGGSITLSVGANTGDLVTIVSNVPSSRTTDYQNNGDFRPDTVNADFDRVVSIAKKIEDTANRTVLLQQSHQDPKPLSLPRPVAGLGIRWNGNETGLENVNLSTVSSTEISADKPVINYDTLLTAINDSDLKLNQACNIKERTTGNGGGAMWDVVLASSVTPNTYNIVASIGNPSVALVLRVKNTLFAEQWGVNSSNSDNIPILQAMVDSKPKEIIIDSYEVLTSASLIVDHNVKISAGIQARLLGDGCRIKNTGTGDCIKWSNTKVIYNGGISNIALQATNGHALSIPFGAVRSVFKNLTLYTTDTTKSCVAALYSGTFGVDFIGMYSCVFEGGEYIVDNVARTAPIIDLLANATAINENIFQNLWISQSKSIQAIRLGCTVAGPYLTNNKFANLNYEICAGGGIVIQGTSHTEISNISFWDTPLGYDGSLIAVDPTTSVNQNRGLTITNVARNGDSLNGAAKDIDLGYSLSTVITNHSPTTTSAAQIDCQNRSCVIMGAENATVINDGATTYVRGGNTESPTFKATEFQTTNGKVINGASADITLESTSGSAELKSTVSGNTIRLSANANTFFGGGGALLPSTDNTINLGHTTNRFATIYAGTGTINTSDERLKTELLPIDEKERLVAIDLKSALRKYKFKDAVKEKGKMARVHFGIGAQTVSSIFKKHGLNPNDYALFCYDEWSKNDEMNIKEGNRYGVRYDELLAFILAAI